MRPEGKLGSGRDFFSFTQRTANMNSSVFIAATGLALVFIGMVMLYLAIWLLSRFASSGEENRKET
jgi:Na+-transporting methylmalonyl-CoA/oxaloacetate decarboxylase gamma subunit